MRRYLLSIIVIGICFAPAIALAAPAVSWFPIVPCGRSGQANCTPCDLFATFKHIIDLVLYGVTGPIAAFIIVWAGGLMLISGDNAGRFKQGQDLLRNTLYGCAIILAAWLVTNTLIKTLATGNAYDAWYEFSCPESLAVIKPIETVLPTGGPVVEMPKSTVLTAALAGIDVVDSRTDLCASDIACPKPGVCSAFTKYTDKLSNGKLVQAIMLNESACRIHPPPSGAGAYGLMQLKPDTAARFRETCKVYTPDKSGNPPKDASGKIQYDSIDAGWLQSDVNVEKIICIGSEYLKSLVGACGSDARGLAAGYNGGPGACEPSRDCAKMSSCSGGTMRRWECLWDNTSHTVANRGFLETRNYAPKVAACAQ